MAQGDDGIRLSASTFNQGKKTKDLRATFEERLTEFKQSAVNGSITLHFSEGYLAKIHATRVD